jgi:PP-loop superfamily ATP-utilizing enzyme
MKNYLSFGGGVNSVAMYLYLLDESVEFEAVFVDHGTDWPETYEYVDMFKKKYPLTVIKPSLGNLYDYCWKYGVCPSVQFRWCTDKFKRRPLLFYHQHPCFVMIGFSFDEIKRAKLNSNNGEEYRYPLIESEINRAECKKIIRKHGLPLPMKSGCYICPFQRIGQWKKLRVKHPELFCKAEQLEKHSMEYRISKGKLPMTLSPKGISLKALIDENQKQLFKHDEYPPCECML